MIKLIGVKRILAILLLLGMNLAVVAGYMMIVAPQMEDIQGQLRQVDGQISELRGKISSIKKDMAFLKDNMPRYQGLRDKGLFQEQDRFIVNRVLGDIRSKNNLSGFSFTVQDLREMPNKEADDMGHRLARSRVDIKILSATLDIDVYGLIQDIPGALPGYTYVKDFSVKKIMEVNEDTLRSLADGKRVGFINANISFDWLTLMPKPEAPAAGSAATPAGFRGR